MHIRLPNVTKDMSIQQMTEVILPSFQNAVKICKPIAILIFY
jgi:hypothetical protein